MSSETYPGARRMLRSPTSPGRAGRKLRYTASGSLKAFGSPSGSLDVGDDCTGFARTPFDCTFQFVAQTQQSKGVWIGSPLFQRKMPVVCQPPRTASTKLL